MPSNCVCWHLNTEWIWKVDKKTNSLRVPLPTEAVCHKTGQKLHFSQLPNQHGTTWAVTSTAQWANYFWECENWKETNVTIIYFKMWKDRKLQKSEDQIIRLWVDSGWQEMISAVNRQSDYNTSSHSVWQSTGGKWWLTHWASLLRWIWSISEYNLRLGTPRKRSWTKNGKHRIESVY